MEGSAYCWCVKHHQAPYLAWGLPPIWGLPPKLHDTTSQVVFPLAVSPDPRPLEMRHVKKQPLDSGKSSRCWDAWRMVLQYDLLSYIKLLSSLNLFDTCCFVSIRSHSLFFSCRCQGDIDCPVALQILYRNTGRKGLRPSVLRNQWSIVVLWRWFPAASWVIQGWNGGPLGTCELRSWTSLWKATSKNSSDCLKCMRSNDERHVLG